jgi:hypothetical protein
LNNATEILAADDKMWIMMSLICLGYIKIYYSQKLAAPLVDGFIDMATACGTAN